MHILITLHIMRTCFMQNIKLISLRMTCQTVSIHYILEIKYRLTNGTEYAGRVEISIGGVWGTICDYYFDDRDASVLCRSKGYQGGYVIENSAFGEGMGIVWLSHLQCQGDETSLHKCVHRGYDVSNSTSGLCGHRYDAAVTCYKSGLSNAAMQSY